MKAKHGESWEKTGSGMPVYVCRPAGKPARSAVIVLQEIFGVNSHMKSLAQRLASEGYAAFVPDLFWRKGEHFTAAYTEIAAGRARAMALKPGEFLEDLGGVLEQVGTKKVGVVGFCMGGRLAFLAATARPELRAAVSFYGAGIPAGPLAKADGISCPLLLFFGGRDEHIPQSDVRKIDQTLTRKGKAHEIVVYPRAHHGFLCDDRGSYDPEAAREAWGKTLEFFSRELN